MTATKSVLSAFPRCALAQGTLSLRGAGLLMRTATGGLS